MKMPFNCIKQSIVVLVVGFLMFLFMVPTVYSDAPPNCVEERYVNLEVQGVKAPVFRCETRRDFLNFFIIGDIGGAEYQVGTRTSYAPTSGQLALANNMVAVKRANGGTVDFIANVGDNFYDNGIDSTEAPKRFKDNFANVYARQGQLRVPFFTIAGNNDYKGNGKVDAQINYPTPFWFFPSEFYVVRHVFGTGRRKMTAAFVMIDTTLLCGPSRKYYKEKYPWKIGETRKYFELVRRALSKANENADYLFVVGHYPVYVTDGGKRSFLCSAELQQMFLNYGVTAYLSGHEHNLKYLQVGNFHQIVSGAGSRMEGCMKKDHVDAMGGYVQFCYPYNVGNGVDTVYDGGAFIDVKLTAAKATFQFWATGGKLYSYDERPIKDEGSRVLLKEVQLASRH